MAPGPFVATIVKPTSSLGSAKAFWARWRHVALGAVLGVALLSAALVTLHVLKNVGSNHGEVHQQSPGLHQGDPAVRLRVGHDDDNDSLCLLPADPGRCRGGFQMYYYDADSRQCRKFIYGGCDEGNGNKFATEEECDQRCGGVVRPAANEHPLGDTFNDCSSFPDSGFCYAYLERFAFNPSTSQCDKFVYGGCGGNRNRYATMEECLDICQTAVARTDYNLKECQVDQCPADCGFVDRRDGCVYCMCNHTPFVRDGEISVPLNQLCPENHVETRQDINHRICVPIPDIARNELN